MHDIEKQITECYHLAVKSIVPCKDYYILHTPKEKKILKRCFLTPERTVFVHQAKEHLAKRGYRNTDRYLCTRDGRPYFIHDNICYTLTNFIEGRESDFENIRDVRKAANLLAQLHIASRGFQPEMGCSIKDDLGKMPGYFEKRLNEIKKMKKIAVRNKSKFDYLFLDYADLYLDMGQKALDCLRGPQYRRLVERSREEGGFCHHDYNHHNIFLGDHTAWVVNFEYCCIELRVYDIANLLRRKMRKCDWNLKDAAVIIDEYRSVDPINEDEIYVLKALLEFPQKFWRVANRFYNSKRSWAEKSYLTRLEEVVAEMEPHKKFMQGYEGLF